MKLSEQGIQLIKGFDGLRTDPYRDPTGFCTIGYEKRRLFLSTIKIPA
jgi:GH24 family phage-related lysozyme (muramidase)